MSETLPTSASVISTSLSSALDTLGPGLDTALVVGFAYLLGAIPTAVLVCHSMGITDPRQQGSGNPGATNVLRIGNRRAALFTLLGDLSKGAVAVALALWLGLSQTLAGLCALAAVLGHVYPFYNPRHGGKGVATTLGSCLILSWPLALCQLGSWLLVIALTRISSLASLTLALLTPLYAWFLLPELTLMLGLIALLLIGRHSRNLSNLWRHNEPQI